MLLAGVAVCAICRARFANRLELASAEKDFTLRPRCVPRQRLLTVHAQHCRMCILKQSVEARDAWHGNQAGRGSAVCL